MSLLVWNGLIVPAICGPFGILPLRLRARLACKAHKGSLNLTHVNQVLGSSYGSLDEAVQNMGPFQAFKVLNADAAAGPDTA